MRLAVGLVVVACVAAALTAGGFAILSAFRHQQRSALFWTTAAVLIYAGQCGFTLQNARTPIFPASASPSPTSTPVAITVPSPRAEPSPYIVPTPSPHPDAPLFRELSIPKPGGTPYAIAQGPDGAMWFTEAECTSGIGRVAPDGTWQHWPITGDCKSQPLAITVGPDANLWFADSWSSFGRITPDGTITRFQMPDPSYPSGITTGPDGNLWIPCASPYGKPFIAKVSPDGTLLGEYPVTPKTGEPRGIVTGPDGAIWFTEGTGIGRLTTSGQLTEYPLPLDNGSGSPFQITVGPDGNLWFVEYMPEGDGRVGRITTSGGITEFETPGQGGLQWITAGPDGALWFTASHSNTIGRISVTGSVTTHYVPSSRAQPTGIRVGPDGNIWFAEEPGDGTGKLGIFKLGGGTF